MKKVLLIFVSILLAGMPVTAATPLVILHANDTHSQLTPYGAGDKKFPGKGGILRREALLRQIRQNEPNVMYVEAGDFVQGTPFFNLFRGDAEIQMMNRLGIDAVTLGNHEFDNGVAFLAHMLEKARFPVVCSGYDPGQTLLRKYLKPWLVVRKGSLRIGVVSANVNPKGLISKKNFEGMHWLPPYHTADSLALFLKKEKKCDLVVCLSHLGLDNKGEAADDERMAEQTRNIDVIIGGHSHTFMNKPERRINAAGDTVIINQAGKGGVYVGRLDLLVD